MKKNYIVSVDEAQSTEQKRYNNELNSEQNYSAELCFNIIQDEYNHVFDRGNKLDNKVNIALTFTGVLFLFIIDLLNIKNHILFPVNELKVLKLIIYSILAFIVLVLYAFSIYLLISIINPMKYQRFNTEVLLKKNMHKMPASAVYAYVSIKYELSIKENNVSLDNQYEKYKQATIFEVVIIGISIFLYIFKYNLL